MAYNSGGYEGSQVFSGTQFQGGDGQYGGGGFLASDESKTFGTQYGDNTQGSPLSSQGGGSGVRKRDEQSLTPVTVKQLKTADLSRDSKIRIDAKDMQQITIVGCMLSIEIQSTNIGFVLDDATGQTNVRHYIDQEEQQRAHKWKAGDYVRVIGNLRVISGELSVVGFQLIPIVDYNEITFHNLEAIHTHLRNIKAVPKGGVKPEAGHFGGGHVVSPSGPRYGTQGGGYGGGCSSSSSSSSSSASSSFQSPGHSCGGGGGVYQSHSSAAAAPAHARAPTSRPITDQNPLHLTLLEMFAGDAQNESGTALDAVVKKLAGNYPEEAVRKAVEYLTDEGHLYSTIDETHFKTTSN